MNRSYLLLLGVAIGAGGIWIATFASRPQKNPVKALASFADEFHRAATRLDAATSPVELRKAELLRDAAARRQAKFVSDSPAYWAEFQRSLVSSGTHHNSAHVTAAQLAKLIDFQEQLETALAEATSVADFDHAWKAWEGVDQSIGEVRGKLLQQLGEKLPSPLATDYAGNLAAFANRIRRLDGFLKEHSLELALLLAAIPPTEPLPQQLQAIVDQVKQIESGTTTALETTKKELDGLRTRMRENSHRVEPTKLNDGQRSAGRCTELLGQLGELAEANQEADLLTWLQLDASAQPLKAPEKNMGDSSERILEAEQLAVKARYLAYNLWALREIHAAETVDSWVERLAQLDTGLLEPVVAALYTSTYSRRLDQLTDPQQRSVVVQQLLGTAKTTADAF